MGMSEGGATAVEEALRLHPTWINGGDGPARPGRRGRSRPRWRWRPGCAATCCASARCGSRPTPRSAARGSRRWRRGPAVSGPMQEWRAPFGATVGRQLDRHERQPVPAPLRRDPRDARPDRRQRTCQRGAQPGRHLPRPDDDGRLPVGAADHLARSGSTTATSRATASIAVVVSDASVAGDLPHPAVRIEAVGTQILERVSWDQDTLTHEPQVLGQAAHLWTRTSLQTGRRRRGAALRRLHLQCHLVARGTRLLWVRRGPGLARRGPPHRAGRRRSR